MNIGTRLRSAIGILFRGSVAPFDRITPVDRASGNADPLRKPYQQSVWAYAAIRHIARPCAAVSLAHSAKPAGARTHQRRAIRRPTDEAILSDPRLDAFWASPAHGMESWAEFILATIGWRKLAGEAFWILGDDAALPFPEVRDAFPRVILARPDRMRHIADPDAKRVAGWEYTDAKGTRHVLLPEQVVHLKQWNPYDDFRGLGEWEAASLAAETDRYSATFARNLAASQGDQGVYVIAKNGVLDDAQRKHITAQLRQKRELQQRGVFAPAFLTGDITVEDPKLRTVDSAFIAGRNLSAAEVYVAFGVPPSMAKESASYSIGSASDYFRLILDTCMPESAEIAAAIGRVSSLLLGRQVWSWFCWDEHPVLQEVRKERMETVDKLWTKGMPMARISEYLDLDLPKFEGDETGWLPIAVVPASQAAELSMDPGPEGAATPAPAPAASADPKPADPQNPADPVQAAVRALQAARAPQARASAADARLWQRHMRLRLATARAYRSAFSRVLFAARAETLRKISALGSAGRQQDGRSADSAVNTGHTDSGAPQAAAARGGSQISEPVSVRAGAVDLMFDLDSFGASLRAAFRRVGAEALETAGKQLYRELGKDDPFKYPPEKAIQFLRDRENKLAGVPADVFGQIRDSIQEGLESGDSIAQLSARVRGAFADCSRTRANRIAMTETAAAYGTARQEGMTQAGVPFKRWLNSGGDNVREAHIEANNQTVPVNEPFDVGGEELMHPGDPSGRPDNIINCHCVSIAVSDPDEGLNTDVDPNPPLPNP